MSGLRGALGSIRPREKFAAVIGRNGGREGERGVSCNGADFSLLQNRMVNQKPEHEYNPRHTFWTCIWCKKPISEWRAFEICHARKAIEWLEAEMIKVRGHLPY